jgi:hypothetical protein
MPELGPYGSARGAGSNLRPYRDSCRWWIPAFGHFQSSDLPENRQANDRFPSAAAVGRRPLEGISSPKPSLTALRRWVDMR